MPKSSAYAVGAPGRPTRALRREVVQRLAAQLVRPPDAGCGQVQLRAVGGRQRRPYACVLAGTLDLRRDVDARAAAA